MAFLNQLHSIRTNLRVLELYREIVKESFSKRQKYEEAIKSRLKGELIKIDAELLKSHRKFMIKDAVTEQAYRCVVGDLHERKTKVENELARVNENSIDVSNVILFSEKVLHHPDVTWEKANLDQKLVLQKAIFPKGLEYDGERFGTAVTSYAFKLLQGFSGGNTKMASPRGFEPLSPP